MHGYRTLHHWNQWLSHDFLGRDLLDIEQSLTRQLLRHHFGKQAILVGVPSQQSLLCATSMAWHTISSPLMATGLSGGPHYIEGDFHELPVLTGSMDLVLLPHTLEFVDNPRQLLSEVCRIIKPEGLVAIFGFNPYSVWGLKKQFSRPPSQPWSGHYLPAAKVKNWLQLADFSLEKQQRFLFRPHIKNESLYQKLHFLEHIGNVCCPMLGAAYVLLARAKVFPLTPIKMKWTQQLTGLRMPTTISGHIARQSK
ncbi:MAG: hypothetical protein A3E85_05170 [Gammaproteobacteria bacterium RIFCSPHIGHO2_12_FULL_45_12]|nr:MAG: hypothetical protein A3E85_05170 [Gammaproteobacteria bacterium RIFCSPHIGHO2_12_FULL_45_12]